jgi:hypothetical protein
METRVEARLNTKAEDGRTAQESREAFSTANLRRVQSRPPTKTLGAASPLLVDAITRGMVLARDADSAGDLNACRRAISEVESLLVH